MNLSKSLFPVLGLLAVFTCFSPRTALPETLVLDDFENISSLEHWQGPVSLSDGYPAHGKGCLEIDLSDRRARTLETGALPRDWSSYELLKFDIYNPSGRIQIGAIQIFDELGTDEEAEIYGKSYRGRKIFLNRGWNHFEFMLQRAMVEDGDRPLALDKIRKFRFDFGRLDSGTLYLDNLRLVKGREEPGTASAADPQDCRVVIDNRYVYPQLAGPVDKIVPSEEIVKLRSEAGQEVSLLKREVELAILQGNQALYWKIPLVTADIGLGLRSKCVWYQGQEKEKEILEYVISSCRKARNEVVTVLSAHQRGEEFESETTPVTWVPPYPRLRGLKQADGYFRDEHGDPVMIFSMMTINQGPLLEFFAPMDHRLESYTVGGGSRGDIETSPVYEAFHKYPDTHRVGWDGWCGHLIKDRWSMGGKKENVVLCLESPHIRQAVLEYMKRRYNEWKHNPHLLYNIMAYELTYICYCETSQRMFRSWLQDKHQSIGKLNSIWGTGYRSFDEITAPATLHSRPVDDVNRAAWYDWACFNSRRFTDYLKWVKSEIRKLDPDVSLNAGGTSSMLRAHNSTSGIDEELIINEVDDVILNESGSSHIFSDLFLSLSEKKKAMVEPEMGGGVHNILLHFLHGKSSITKWCWPQSLRREYPEFAAQSIPHSWSISLPEVAEVLRLALDVRRLRKEIAEFTRPEPEVAILYSKSSILQVPPRMIRAGRTPYLDAVFSTWEGSRYLGCRIGFVSEKQILSGKLSRFKLLIVPAAKYSRPEVADAVLDYIENGGTAVLVPESFLFDQYARQNDRVAELGLKVKDVTLPQVLGEGELVQNYDQSFTQTVVYGEVKNTVITGDLDIFHGKRLTLHTGGLVQSLDPGDNPVLARFEDGKPAIVLVKRGRGRLYYLASPLAAGDYHKLLALLADDLGLQRPVLAVDSRSELITTAEVRAVERDNDYLVYASNLGGEPVEFDLKGEKTLGQVEDLRRLRPVPGGHVKLGPWEETILRVDKK
ncbi:MAG: beta-galactosidase [Gemmatimonadota bacterium]|nr:beta-galactosidase [Gemmatimonadota bacterium]